MAEENIALRKVYNPKPFYMASVEIIIPFHDQHSLVANLLTDIFATVLTNKYLVTLVDDGSKNKDFLNQIKSKKIPGVRFLRQEDQRGFGAAVNLALSNPFPRDIPFVCVLHSDVRLKDSSWLEKLGSTLVAMKEDGVKMVCPRTDKPEAPFPELVSDGKESVRDFVLVDGYVPMYCFLANRQLFSRVGLLSECPYAGVEAEDYAMRMRNMGFKQGVCGSSWVEHSGRGTLSMFDGNKRVQEILRNVKQDFDNRYKKTSMKSI